MSELLVYLLKVSLGFSALTLTYYSLLRRLTFHSFNRLVLLLAVPISLALPLIDFGWATPLQFKLLNEVPALAEATGAALPVAEVAQTGPDWWFIVNCIYLMGVGLSVALLVLNALRLFHTLRLAKPYFYGDYELYTANIPAVFSSFGWVFVPEGFKPEENPAIVKHELAHVRLGHSYDLLLAELCIALCWFNPLVYAYRRMLKAVHEYQADEQVLRGAVKKSDYLGLMLQSTLNATSLPLASGFNSFLIKNRIHMITKHKNNSLQAVRYALLLPVITLLMMSFTSGPGSQPSIFPLEEGSYYKITARYGLVREVPGSDDLSRHGGIDISAKEGTPIKATGAGTVIKAKNEGNWGNLVVIDHGDVHQIWYAHMQNISVTSGQTVSLGRTIGTVGNTGVSTGPHLHYEVRKGNERVNPENYFKQ